MTEQAITFGGTDFAAGVIAALIFGLLIKIRAVAMSVAAVLVVSLLYASLDPRGLGFALEELVRTIGQLASTGALTGAMMATTIAGFLKSLVKTLTTPQNSKRDRGRNRG